MRLLVTGFLSEKDQKEFYTGVDINQMVVGKTSDKSDNVYVVLYAHECMGVSIIFRIPTKSYVEANDIVTEMVVKGYLVVNVIGIDNSHPEHPIQTVVPIERMEKPDET